MISGNDGFIIDAIEIRKNCREIFAIQSSVTSRDELKDFPFLSSRDSGFSEITKRVDVEGCKKS